jgi:hypothetical protein
VVVPEQLQVAASETVPDRLVQAVGRVYEISAVSIAFVIMKSNAARPGV